MDRQFQPRLILLSPTQQISLLVLDILALQLPLDDLCQTHTLGYLHIFPNDINFFGLVQCAHAFLHQDLQFLIFGSDGRGLSGRGLLKIGGEYGGYFLIVNLDVG